MDGLLVFKGGNMKDAAYDEFIDKLRVASDIVSIISEYVPLKKSGRNYWGSCPFHHEKTASFSVTQDKGFFYCFGCQTGGNVFNFLMRLENISFFEAAKLLASKLNIPVPEKEKSDHDKQVERELANLYRANVLARDFFHSCLTKTNYGKIAREYLSSRGISEQAQVEFQLGFAPPAWDKLAIALAERGFAADMLVKAGLSLPRSSGNGIYDRFRDRIMIPISDHQGRVVGFGGRVMDGSQPKYLNSPETAIFNKRQILFGFDKAYQSIRQSGKAIVVEGYMDLIAVHMSGIKNAVASLGTAFTPEQAKRLARYAGEIDFAYDSDAAGQNATLRALTTVRSMGLNVRVVAIPDGKDPDDYIRKHGTEAFQALVSNALALLDFQVRQAIETTDYSSLDGKVSVISKAVPALAEADNAVEVNAYIAKLSELLAIDEGAIRTEIRKYKAIVKKDKNVNRGKAISITGLTQQPATAVTVAERQLIRLMFEDNSVIPYVQTELSVAEIQGEHCKTIINLLFDAYNREKSLSAELLAVELTEAAANELSNIMVMDIQLSDIARMVDDFVKKIRLAGLNNKIKYHSTQADELERMGDSRYLQELTESQRIKDEIRKLHQS